MAEIPVNQDLKRSKVPEVKPLYLAKCLEDLLSKLKGLEEELKKRLDAAFLLGVPDLVAKEAEKTYSEGVRALESGDQEVAFLKFAIYLKSWISLEETCCPYTDGMPTIDEKLMESAENTRKDALWNQQKLERSLKRRYHELNPTLEKILSGSKTEKENSEAEISNESNAKELYLDSSIKGLKDQADRVVVEVLKKLDAVQLLDAYQNYLDEIERIFDEAIKTKDSKDEEMAYVQFTVCVLSCKALEECAKFNQNPLKWVDSVLYDKMMNNYKEALWEVDRLEIILQRRYDSNRNQITQEDTTKTEAKEIIPRNINNTDPQQSQSDLDFEFDDIEIEPLPLYMSSNFSHLDSMANDQELVERLKKVKESRDYQRLLKEMDQLYQGGRTFYLNGDQEMAFIFLSRFLKACDVIVNFKLQIPQFDKILKQMPHVKKVKEKLAQQLKDSFDQNKIITVDDLMAILSGNSNDDEEWSYSGQVGEASVIQPYILIVDCRYTNDFQESHIQVKQGAGAPISKVINIPVHENETQLNLAALLGRSEAEARKELESAFLAMRVVILDWDSDRLKPTAPATLLHRVFSQLETPEGGRLPTSILKGGFTAWFSKYSQHTTNKDAICREFFRKGSCNRVSSCPFNHKERCPICKKLCLDPSDRESRDKHIVACAEDKASEREALKECKICMDKPVDRVIHPCGHAVACNSCLTSVQGGIKQCPYCRGNINNISPIYFP